MNKRTKLVSDLLKPKASHLGFTKEELEGVAEKVASNLAVTDEASEEELNAAATKAVDAAIPFLELSQRNANRIIQKNKEEREKAEAEAKAEAEEEARIAAEKAEAERKAKAEADRLAKEEAERKAAEEAARKAAEEAGFQKLLDSDWAKGLKAENEKLAKLLKERDAREKAREEQEKQRIAEFENFRNEFNALKAERVKANREKLLEEAVADAGVFGERIKKNYTKMHFDTDEDFSEFIAGVKDDIAAFNQERADKGLETLGTPKTGDQQDRSKVEPMTDAEIDALAAIM